MNSLTLFKAESLLSLDSEHYGRRISRSPSPKQIHKSTSSLHVNKSTNSSPFFSRQSSRASSTFSSPNSSRASSPAAGSGADMFPQKSSLRRVVSSRDTMTRVKVEKSFSEHSEHSIDVSTRRKTRSETKQMSHLERSISYTTPEQGAHKKVSNIERVVSQRKRATGHSAYTDTNSIEKSVRSKTVEDSTRGESVSSRSICWSTNPQVIDSGLLNTLSEGERILQEAIYEILTSEETYRARIQIAIDHYHDKLAISSPGVPQVCTLFDLRRIFVNLKQIGRWSESMLNVIFQRQGTSIIMVNFFDIIEEYASNIFPKAVVNYLSHETSQTQTLNQLMKKPEFRARLNTLEKDPDSQGYTLKSLLVLPMQHVTRAPLMFENVLGRLSSLQGAQRLHKDLEEDCRRALVAVSSLARLCDEEYKKMENFESLINIQTQLTLPPVNDSAKLVNGRPPVINLVADRDHMKILLKKGEVEQVIGKAFISGKKTSKLYLFVFKQLLLICSSDESSTNYTVLGLASNIRANIDADCLIDAYGKLKFPANNADTEQSMIVRCGNYISASDYDGTDQCIMDSPRKKYLLLSLSDRAERERWFEAFCEDNTIGDNLQGMNLEHKWFKAVKEHVSGAPDESNLFLGDLVKSVKVRDSWVKGIKLKDLQRGWLPKTALQEITDEAQIKRFEAQFARLYNQTLPSGGKVSVMPEESAVTKESSSTVGVGLQLL